MHTPIAVFCSAGLLALLATGQACANGVGENGSWQFRSAANRQILLAQETERQNLVRNLGVGSSSGLGTQTGNAVSVTIGGSNNNLSLNASNTGSQAISDNMLNY
ncbi:MAG TPA: VCBS domain-containing protein [Devosia sp.]|jgi:VCBS repeat-containing protein|nr:VCBS domain-containing protein [Devosia sp.]